MKYKLLTFKLIFLLMLTLTFTTVVAAPVVSNSGFLSGVTATGTAEAIYAGPGYWYCGVISDTSPDTTINIIGWTWWSCDQFNSSGSLVSRYSFGALAKTDDRASNSTNISNAAGATSVKSHGVHDFNHTGASPSPWRPYNYAP